MSDKIRIGIIGVGQIGKVHVQRYKDVPEAEIVAICDIREDEAQRVAQANGISVRLYGLPRPAGARRYPVGGRRAAQPPARADDDRRARGGQERLLREAHVVELQRREVNARRGAAHRPAAAHPACHDLCGGGARGQAHD